VQEVSVGLEIVIYREKTTSGAHAVNTVTHRRQPLVAVRDSCFLTEYFK
jgi:hypothetical protein